MSQTTDWRIREDSESSYGTEEKANCDEVSKIEANCDEVAKIELKDVVVSFNEMDLKPMLLKGIHSFGLTNLLDIQQRAIIPCINGQDVIVQAPSETGKTTAFSIALLQKIASENPFCQALILVPTRELAQQIHSNILALGEYTGVTCHACVGGSNVKDEKKIFENGVQIIVGTPGRVLDMIKRRSLKTDSIQMFVIDVADEMLRKRFKDQLDKILIVLNVGVQFILSSIEMPPKVLEEAKKFMNDSLHIVGRKKEGNLEKIKPYCHNVEGNEREFNALPSLFEPLFAQSIVSCNSRQEMKKLSNEMTKDSESSNGAKAKCNEVSKNELKDVAASFDEMDLKPMLLKGIHSFGFADPLDIQKRAIIPCIKEQDVIVQAPPETGKTTAFSIAVLQKIKSDNQFCQALILVPVRELAQQINKNISALGDKLGVTCHACFGGSDVHDDVKILKNGVQIVVGTPGRVLDMIKRRKFNTDSIQTLVIDVAEELLRKQFKDQLDNILKRLILNKGVQIILSSSIEIPPKVSQETKKFMLDPVHIVVKVERNLEEVKQYFHNVEKNDRKFDALSDLFGILSTTKSIVFCNSLAKVDGITTRMRKKGHNVHAMHQDMNQKERDGILKDFHSGPCNVLISTDRLAQGRAIQTENVPLIVNFDFPTNPKDYFNRIVVAGMLGKKGVAINFITNKEQHILKRIEQFHNAQIIKMPGDFATLFQR